MSEKVLMKGNEAFAEAVIRGGCRFYFGYPITPQSEIPEFMSRELPKRGGRFLQAESELGAINMAYGCGAAGGSAFISSSSPGISLMQEGMSFLCSAEVPLVLLNVSRCGPGIGGIQPGQADYFQVTRGGGNGDYKMPVFAPASIQEAVDILYEAPALADKWRNPIMVLADGIMGQMMEPVHLPEEKKALTSEDIPAAKPWAISGSAKGERSVVKSLRLQPEVLEAHVEHLFEKYERMENELVRMHAAHAGSHRRRTAVCGFAHIHIHELMRYHTAANGSHADGLAQHIHLLKGFHNDAVCDAMRASRAIAGAYGKHSLCVGKYRFHRTSSNIFLVLSTISRDVGSMPPVREINFTG